MDDYIILVVEDNPDDQLLTVRALRKACRDNPVIVLEDGQEALDYLFEDNIGPDDVVHRIRVILLDIKLPRVNGLEVLKHLRSNPRTNWLPIVMVSSSDEPGEQLEAYRLGANSYINKPVDFEQFTDHMRVFADYWLKVNKLPHPQQVKQG